MEKKYILVKEVSSMSKVGDLTKEFPENLTSYTHWMGVIEYFDGTQSIPNWKKYHNSQNEWIIEYLSKGYIIDTIIEREEKQK